MGKDIIVIKDMPKKVLKTNSFNRSIKKFRIVYVYLNTKHLFLQQHLREDVYRGQIWILVFWPICEQFSYDL